MSYKVGDRVQIVRADLDIYNKTATVTDEALPGGNWVLVKLDNPDQSNPSQMGRISLKESWLSRLEEKE